MFLALQGNSRSVDATVCLRCDGCTHAEEKATQKHACMLESMWLTGLLGQVRLAVESRYRLLERVDEIPRTQPEVGEIVTPAVRIAHWKKYWSKDCNMVYSLIVFIFFLIQSLP